MKPCWSCAPENCAAPVGRGRQVVESVRQGLAEDGNQAPAALRGTNQGDDRGESFLRLSHDCGASGRQQEHSATHLPAQGRAVKKRPVGFRPRVQALPSVAQRPNERWATDLCRIWAGKDGWSHLALVIDCCTRELLGWHLSRSGKSKTAESALEHALISRFGCLGRVPETFLLRSDNGQVFTSRNYTALVRRYGLQQEFIKPYTPEQNGMVERVIRTLKEVCTSTPLRKPDACQPSHCRLDWFL